MLACAPLRLNYAGKNFESTGSPCVDALFVNVDATECNSIYVNNVPDWHTYTLRCVDQNLNVSNEWTRRRYYVLAQEYDQGQYWSEDFQWECADRKMIIYSRSVETPRNKQ